MLLNTGIVYAISPHKHKAVGSHLAGQHARDSRIKQIMRRQQPRPAIAVLVARVDGKHITPGHCSCILPFPFEQHRTHENIQNNFRVRFQHKHADISMEKQTLSMRSQVHDTQHATRNTLHASAIDVTSTLYMCDTCLLYV